MVPPRRPESPRSPPEVLSGTERELVSEAVSPVPFQDAPHRRHVDRGGIAVLQLAAS